MWSATLFSVRGIDVRVHASFALIVALGATQWGVTHGARGALFGAVFTLALFACVLLHELGHSVVAQRFGLKVKEVTLLPIGGVATLLGKPRNPKQEVAIALAGPAVNVVLALLLVGVIGLLRLPLRASYPSVAELAPSWSTLLVLLTAGNVMLAVFNLLPFYPLDGGRVLRALLTTGLGERRATSWAAGIGQAGGLAMAGFAVAFGQLMLGLVGLFVFLSASRERVAARLSHPLRALRAADVAELPAVELESTARIGEATTQLLRSVQEAFPVVADGEVVGVVSRADLLAAAHRPELALHSIRTLMREVPQLPAHLSAAEALELLTQMNAPLGLVVTRDYPLGFISEPLVLSKLAQLPLVDWSKSERARSEAPAGPPRVPGNLS